MKFFFFFSPNDNVLQKAYNKQQWNVSLSPECIMPSWCIQDFWATMPCFSIHYRKCSHSAKMTKEDVKHDTYRAGINHFQPKEICIPLVKPNQRTNSIKGTVGVLTWGHLSHWLLTASCSDIWPHNLAWQWSSNTLRPVRQTHTYSWKQPDALTVKFTKSHFFFFFLKRRFVFADACRCTWKHYSRASFDFIANMTLLEATPLFFI